MVAALQNRREHVAIGGSGIVGISCALALIQNGYRVTLIDRDEPAAGCSFGNAGMTWCPWVVPLARAGIARKLPGMLLRPDSPLTIRPSYWYQGLGWMRRALKEVKPDRVAASSTALADLIGASIESTKAMVDVANSHDLIRHDGWIEVYRNKSSFEADADERAIQNQHNVAGTSIGPREIRELAPAISEEFQYGIWNEAVSNTRDPGALARRFFDAFIERGGEYVKTEIHSIAFGADGTPVFITDRAPIAADKAVIALGAWSASLVEQLDGKVPLAAERGYHSVCPTPEVDLGRPVVFKESGFVATPMNSGLRLAGMDEFASLRAPANPKIVHRIRKLAKHNIPGLNTDRATEWMGARPALPDSLPVISTSVSSDRVIYAFGHHHLGLTCGPATGDIVRSLVSKEKPAIDITPFRVQRLWSV